MGAGGRPTKTRSRFADVENRAVAIAAIRRLGWNTPIAAKAVDAVLEECGIGLPLDELIRAALPRCVDER